MLHKNLLGHVLVVTGILLCTLPASAFGQEPRRNQHALLVGCTVYPNLAERYHLAGPGNDVLLAKKMLVERFGFHEENVTILADNAGGSGEMPTRANIERQWRRLADVAQKGDQVLVLMAGHGSQSPQLIVDEDNPETDGLDEVFLPRDVGKWTDQVGTVENAIKDDDIRKWVRDITDKGASLWVIIDACHSGTMTRDASDEVKRELPPEVLGVPEEALQKAYAGAAARGTDDAGESQLVDSPEKTRGVPGSSVPVDPNAPVVVALYASQSIEPTVEKKLPIGGAKRDTYGLLTYTLSEILSRAESTMTYRELVAQIHRQYVNMGRMSPTPVLEGTAIDREVLGLNAFPERSRIVVSKDRGSNGWKINAGALSGVTKGSVLALYPPAGEKNSNKAVGHARILDDGFGALEARVAPCAYGDLPAPGELAAGMRAETVFVDFGDQRLKIGVDRLTDEGDPVSDDEWRDLELPLTQFATENAHLVEMVNSDKADWLLRYDNTKSKKLFLVPAAGWPGQDEGAQRPPLFGPAPSGAAGLLVERFADRYRSRADSAACRLPGNRRCGEARHSNRPLPGRHVQGGPADRIWPRRSQAV